MSTQIEPAPANPAVKFRQTVTTIATRLLEDWVGRERAAEAVGRVAAALSASAAAARNPADFYACTPQSVGQVVATSALTGIMVGTGALALAYAIPRRARKGEAPQLQYQLSHRGICALARRAGNVLIPVPVGRKDHLVVVAGEVAEHTADIDDPPTTWDELRGVIVVLKDTAGTVLFRGWVPRKLIEERRAQSDAFQYAERNAYAQKSSPWHVNPVPMGMKTALHYAAARGWVVIDDTEAVRALSADAASDVIEIEAAPEVAQPAQIETTSGGLDALEDALFADALDGDQPEPLPAEPPKAEPAKPAASRGPGRRASLGPLGLAASIEQGERAVGPEAVERIRGELGISETAVAADLTGDTGDRYLRALSAAADEGA